MRYYFIAEDEVVFDILEASKINENTYRYLVKDQKKDKTIWVRKLANKMYYSMDQISWNKIAILNSPKEVLHINTHYKLFRGFKPSTFSQGGEGDLVTQMPGKVVKVVGKLGQKVNKGDTLVILEAMKMENEIKAGTSGIIKTIFIKEGQALEAGFNMMEIEVSDA